MGRYVYPEGFREQFVQMMRDRRAPKCRVCNRPQRPEVSFTNCPRCGWLLCPQCQQIHRPERHDWKEGAPTDLTNCEMCDKPSEDLAPCTACLYMLCSHCRSLHKPEQHKGGSRTVALDRRAHDEILRRTTVRIGDPPHGETPKVKQFEPDCSDCSKWHERFKSVFAEELNLYLREQEGVWEERRKEIMNDLEISDEEIGGPL
jgi:hypothetical protein